jgi:hypothetical protein
MEADSSPAPQMAATPGLTDHATDGDMYKNFE